MLLFTCRCLRTTLGDDKADRFLPPLLSIPPAVKQRDREGHRSTSSITVKIERRSPKPIEVLLINSISTFPWNNILNLSADENPEVLKVGIRRHLEPVLRSMPGEMDRTPRGAGRREHSYSRACGISCGFARRSWLGIPKQDTRGGQCARRARAPPV